MYFIGYKKVGRKDLPSPHSIINYQCITVKRFVVVP